MVDFAVTQRYGPVERATRSELRRLRCSVLTNTLGALAVSLAQQMDADGDAKGAAVVASQLRLVIADLKATGPVTVQKDSLDELNARRAVRRAAEG